MPSTFTVVNTNDDENPGSLRWAIEQSNATPGANVIDFNIGGSGVQTISLQSALPAITTPVLLDGTSQPGFAGTPLIVLDGTSAGAGVNGLSITAGSSTVEDLAIDNFTGTGIALQTNGGNVLAGNYVGVDSTGAAAAGNGGDGISVATAHNTIGGTAAGAANVVSANAADGVWITGNGASSNLVEGNFIGTDVTGTTALGNGGSGIAVLGQAGPALVNTIGGTTATARNVISGNTRDGITLDGQGTTNVSSNTVEGNYIGTDVTGTAALGNGVNGVSMVAAARNNNIGGTAAGAANVISANRTGVLIMDMPSSGNQVQDNRIGTDVTGTAALGNGTGVELDSPDGASISGNVISANTADGVLILANGPFTLSTVAGNLIGTDVTGTANLGNGGNGITVNSSASNTDGINIRTNTIAFNGNDGVFVTGAANNHITSNVISANTTNGVEMFSNGATGNVVQGNFIGTDPTGTTALANGNDGVAVRGGADRNTVGGTASGSRNVISANAANGVEVFAAGTTGNLVEGNYIGTDVTGAAALANGNDGVSVHDGANRNTVGGTTAAARNVISANAANGVELFGSGASGNVVLGNFIGTDLNGTAALGNGGDGVSLHDGANRNTVGGTAAGSRNVISANTTNGVEIFVASTTGNVVQGNFIGTDVTGTARLGNGGDGVALHDGAGSNTVGGTTAAARNVISANGANGVRISGSGASGNVVQGNYIGTDATGAAALGNSGDGVSLHDWASANMVGGTAAGSGNVISANTANGVEIFVAGTTGNAVLGNFIGTDVNGTAALGNGNDGVALHDGASSNTVGGTAAGSRNVISANTANGVEISVAGTTGNAVLGNLIGTDVTGTAALANGGDGVSVHDGAATNIVGGTTAAARNLISANTANGVEVFGSGASGNAVQGNFIGTDVNGTAALGNGNDGVALHDGASANTVGGTAAGSRNVISANTANGVEIFTAGAATTGNVVEGNYIGTDVSGTAVLANGANGVLLTAASNNTVGGTAAGAGNVIANSGNDGVKVDTGTGDAIRDNSISASTNLGIELVNNGNNNQVPPGLTSAASGGGNITIQGALSAAANTSYALDFFASPTANASGAGEGKQYLGSAAETTDGTGNVTFTVTFPVGVPAGQIVSATATDPASNTSAFAQDVTVTAAATGWVALGPAPLHFTYPASENFSGRVVGIAPSPTDPNTIYLAAAGGGVWKTADGGGTWASLTDNQVTLTMGAIAVAPSNPNVIYAGTGEANNAGDSYYGRGILVSTDGGATWTLTGNTALDRLAVAKIAVDPTDPNTAYAAVSDFATNGRPFTGGAGIWKTTDGGATWTNKTAFIEQDDPFSDVAIDPSNHNTVYMAIGDPDGDPYGHGAQGVYKSTDGGSSWLKLGGGLPTVASTIGRITLAVAPSNPQVVYASVSGTGNPGSTSFGTLFKLMRSDNGGTTWTDLTSGTPNYMYTQGWYDSTLIVDPANSAIVYAGGAAGPAFSEPPALIRSTNSGVSWSDLDLTNNSVTPHADHHAIAFDASGRLLDGDDGGIFRLESPSPVQWSDLNGNLNTIQFTGISLSPTNPNVAIGGSQDNGTDLYGGNPLWNETDGGDGGFAKFSPTNGNRVYHQAPPSSFGTNFFRRSDDGGNTWATKTTGIVADINNQNFYAPFVVDPGNGDRVLYGTDRVWETTTAGDSWAAISPVLVNSVTDVDAIGLAAGDANTVYASFGGEFASSSQIFVTTNHGATWVEQDLPSGSGRVNDLEVDPTNAQVAYAVVSRFTGGGGHVFRTTNGGATWTDITGNLPDLPTWTLQLAKPTSGDVLYVGNDDGVYRSTDLGVTWSRLSTGLPHAQVSQLALNSALGLLGAGTYGRGMWELSVATPGASPPPGSPRLNPPAGPAAGGPGTSTFPAPVAAPPGRPLPATVLRPGNNPLPPGRDVAAGRPSFSPVGGAGAAGGLAGSGLLSSGATPAAVPPGDAAGARTAASAPEPRAADGTVAGPWGQLPIEMSPSAARADLTPWLSKRALRGTTADDWDPDGPLVPEV